MFQPIAEINIRPSVCFDTERFMPVSHHDVIEPFRQFMQRKLGHAVLRSVVFLTGKNPASVRRPRGDANAPIGMQEGKEF